MGSFKKIVLPIFKEVVHEIKAVGMKRAMTAARVIVDGLQARIVDDDHLSRAELRELGALTKNQAHALAQQILVDGLNLSGGAADALIVAAVKAKNRNIPMDETGIKPEDEDEDDDDS